MFSNEKLQFLGETGTTSEWIPFAVFLSFIILAIVAAWLQIKRDEKMKMRKQGLKNNPQVKSSVYPSHYENKQVA